jgi:hypothetical protein
LFVDVLADVATDVAVPSWDWEMVWKTVCIFAIGAGITSAVVNTAAEMPSATRRFNVLRSVILESTSCVSRQYPRCRLHARQTSLPTSRGAMAPSCPLLIDTVELSVSPIALPMVARAWTSTTPSFPSAKAHVPNNPRRFAAPDDSSWARLLVLLNCVSAERGRFRVRIESTLRTRC